MLSPPDTPPSPSPCKQLALPEPPCDQPLPSDQQPKQSKLDKVARLKQVEAEVEKHIDNLLEVQDKFLRDIKHARERLMKARDEIVLVSIGLTNDSNKL